jgi:hypothetical protein
LSSLYTITYDDYEVILVDNNSSDGSVAFVRQNFPDVVVKQLDANYGFAKANNIGADIAKGKLLLFLNNDTKVTEGFLEPLVDEIVSNDIAICQSLLLKFDGTVDSAGDFVDKYGRAYNSKTIPEKTSPILSARGACMMIKKDVFDELGGFDEKFFVSFEDIDLGLRSCMWGFKTVIVPNSIVYHYGSTTISKMAKEIRFHALKNILILQLVNFETWTSLKNLTFLFSEYFFRKLFNRSIIPKYENQSPIPSLQTVFKTLFWLIKNLTYIKNKKQLVNSKKIRTTDDLLKFG